MRICLITREEIYTYSVKENLSCSHLNAMLLRTLMRMHFITPYHIMHVSIYAFMISYFMLMHIGSSEGSLYWNSRRRRRGTSGGTLAHSSRRRGASSWGPTQVPGSSANFFSQRQDPEHFKPPMFYEISLESFMFDALVVRVGWKHLMHRTTLSRYIYF